MSNQHPQQTYNQYKIRGISWNHIGVVYGISIPREIAIQFEGIKFNIVKSGNNIILYSGQDLIQLKRDMEKEDKLINL